MKEIFKRNKIGIFLISTGFLFMLLGAYRQEIGTVWMKAAAICLECVGIG